MAVSSLPDGDLVEASTSNSGNTTYQVHVQLFGPDGSTPIGPAFTETAPPVSLFDHPVIAPLADGSYDVEWAQQGNYSSQLLVEHFTAQGTATGQTTVAAYGGFSTIDDQAYSIAGLPDGGYVAGWTLASALSGSGTPNQSYIQEFSASGAPVGGPVLLGDAASAGQAPVIEAEAGGQYLVSWNGPQGPEHETLTEQGSTPAQAADVSGAVADTAPTAVHPLASAQAAGHGGFHWFI